MDNSTIKYLFPPVDCFREGQLTEKQKISVLEKEEKVFNSIIQWFSENQFKITLTGISSGLCDTYFRFEISTDSITNYFGLKRKIKDLCDNLKIELVEGQESIEKPNLQNKIRSKIAFRWEKSKFAVPSLKRGLQSKFNMQNGEVATTLFCDGEGNSYPLPLSKIKFSIISSGESYLKDRMVCGMLLDLAYKYTPNEVKFLLFGRTNEYLEEINGFPHMIFGNGLYDMDQAFPCLQYLNGVAEERRAILKEGGFKDIYAYNAVNAQKLPCIIAVISDFRNIIGFYGVYHKVIEREICKIIKDGQKLGISLICTANSSTQDYLKNNLRTLATAKVSFQTQTSMSSFNNLGITGAENLYREDQCLFVDEDNECVRAIAYSYSFKEYQKACNFIKNNNPGYQPSDCSNIINQAKNGPLSFDNRAINEDITLLKEVLRIAFNSKSIAGWTVKNILNANSKQIANAIKSGTEKGYLKLNEDLTHSINITKSQFEEIFGEKL